MRQLLNQSSADMTKWAYYGELKSGEDNLVLRKRLKTLSPDLSRLYETRELKPRGESLQPKVFIEFVLTADRPFLRHATACSGNSADAFGAPHCNCHGPDLHNFTFCKRTHYCGRTFESMCHMAHVPVHVALGKPAPPKWSFTCPGCNEVRTLVPKLRIYRGISVRPHTEHI